MIQVPIQIKIIGNETLGRSYIGPAKSQMNILRNQMKFQKLNQGFRTIRLADNIYIECRKIYNTEVCTIIAIVAVVEEVIDITTTKNRLLIVIGDVEQVIYLTNVTTAFEAEEAINGSGCSGIITSVGALDIDSATQVIYGEFDSCVTKGVTITGNITNAAGTIELGLDRYFQRSYMWYEFPELLTTLVETSPEAAFPEIEIVSALDSFPPSSIPNGFNITIDQEWSKTVGKFMLSAFTHYSEHKYEMNWTVSASYDGELLTWDGETEYFGDFKRTVLQYILSYDDAVKTHIGFDLWQDDDSVYWASILSDQEETLYVFKLDRENNNLLLQNTYSSTVRKEKYLTITELPEYSTQGYFMLDADVYKTADDSYPEDANIYKLIRLLGYGYDQEINEHVAYWGELCDNFWPGKSNTYSFLFYCKEILNTGEITLHFLPLPDENYSEDFTKLPTLNTAIWNPITRKLYPSYEFYDAFLREEGEFVASAELESVEIYDKKTDTIDYNGATNTTATYYYQLTPSSPWDSITLACAAYVHPDENSWYVSNTTYRFKLEQPNYIYNRGTLAIATDVYEKGIETKTTLLTDYGIAFTSYNTAYCGDEYETDNYLAGLGDPQCTPTDAYDYELNKWVFTNNSDEIIYAYQANEIESAIDCDNDKAILCVGKCSSYAESGSNCINDAGDPCRSGDCSCLELDWEIDTSIEIIPAELTILDAASDEFPYDQGWTAILLKGTDRKDKGYSNWVIYKDLENDTGYFAVSDTGETYQLGEYDRAFFYNFTTTEEVE